MTGAKRTPVQHGRYARRKGATAERDFARYLRTHGWPNARRAVASGWHTDGHTNHDTGDVAEVGPLVFQVKSANTLTDTEVERGRREAQTQRRAADAELGFLIQRRSGKADPGHWWAWIELVDLVRLLYGPLVAERYTGMNSACRFTVADLVCLLHGAGYGAKEASA